VPLEEGLRRTIPHFRRLVGQGLGSRTL
jgi:hypothetical protein